MGLTSAFNNAFSGLNVSARRAELVSNNVSNAMTVGFARREIHLSSDVLNGVGGGVRIADISRIENSVMTSARREAEAVASNSTVAADFLSRVSNILGNPGEAGALAVQYVEFESSLTGAANDPSNEILLSDAVNSAKNIAKSLNKLSTELNDFRLEADNEIEQQVKLVNSTLSEISDLNLKIREISAAGGSTNSLKDRQNLLIDKLNVVIPVKVVEKEFGRISVFTPAGGTLLDGRPTSFDFSAVPAISHAMTLANGALSDLSVNGGVVSMNTETSFFDGGTLGALFDARDAVLPGLSEEIDGLAADLITRFQSPTVDSTLTVTDSGLFTDDGGQYLLGNEVGLAGRLSLNSAVDLEQGGQPWRLRSGLNSAAPGDVGVNSTLRGYLNAFQANVTPSVGIISANHLSGVGFASFFATSVSEKSAFFDENLSFETAKFNELHEAELDIVGVDTDSELQSLMELETAYAANARVMSVLDDLLGTLLEI